jgi:hypothetical protein
MISKTKIASVAVLLSILAAVPVLAHNQGEGPGQNVKRLMQVQINRSEKALSRMSEILDRIEKTRADLASTNDLSRADALITKAKAQKTKVEQSLAAAKEKYQGFDASSKPREQVKAFMAEMKNVKAELIQLHKDLKAVIKTMKEIKKS